MKLLRLVVAASIATAVAVVGMGTAQAYPTPVFSLTLNRHVVYGGQTVQATVKADVTCTTWTVQFLDQTATGHNSETFVHTFTTTKVTKKQQHQVTARCTYDAAAVGAGHAVRIVAAESGLLHSPVTILPRSSGSGGVSGNGHNGNGSSGSTSGNGSGSGLPNTGGPAFWIALLALALVLGGGVAMARNRRHSTAGAPPANATAE